jgi:thioredoxin reductase
MKYRNNIAETMVLAILTALSVSNVQANLPTENSVLQTDDGEHSSVAETVADVVIDGGTSAAVMTAVQVRRMGKSVVIVCRIHAWVV